MTPIQAILRKESRQQGGLALAMVLFCLVIQLSAFLLSLFPEFGNNTPDYFAIAVFVTALFTGAAAAISFSGEQDERTFGFLRSLPVSARSIFLGKAAWIVLGTACVLLGTLLLAGLWTLLAPEARYNYGRFSFSEIAATFGFGILEAFVWGLFWSPRCRSQVYALLATYFCASTAGYFCAIYVRGGTNFAEIYSSAIPLRLAVLAVVGVFAVRGGLRWFDFWKQGPAKAGLLDGVRKSVFGRLPFPKRIQSPFFALAHQGFRQSQLFLLVGFISGLVCLRLSIGQGMDAAQHDYYFNNRLFAAFTIVYFLVLCGSIFGADQKNGMYRFFGRCGVRPGTLWWSRVLTMLLVVLPILLVMFVWYVDMHFSSLRYNRVNGFTRWQALSAVFSTREVWPYGIPTVVAIWLIPFSCGALLSISVKRMIVAVALTGAASGVLFFWMAMGLGLFGLSPLWTTLPLCLMLLIASRLQAENWIRERTGWRRYVKSLVPFFIVGTVILAAVPVVRVYSIPFVPLAEVERVMDSADLVERLSPTERRALFHEVAANRNKPLPHGEPIRPLIDSGYHNFMMFQGNLKFLAQRHDDPEIVLKTLQAECRKRELQMETTPKFEEWLLRNYEINYRIFHTKGIIPVNRRDGGLLAMYRFCPWENERMLRRFTAFLVMAVEDADRMPPDYKSSAVVQRERRRFHHTRFTPLFDDYPWEWQLYATAYFHSLCYQRFYLVHHALQLWYLEHGETLPETLDELVAENYLKRIPTDPRTGEPMRYVRDFDESQIEKNRHQILSGTKPGWPNLEFGRIGVNEIRVDLRFLPGYDEYGQRPGQ